MTGPAPPLPLSGAVAPLLGASPLPPSAAALADPLEPDAASALDGPLTAIAVALAFPVLPVDDDDCAYPPLPPGPASPLLTSDVASPVEPEVAEALELLPVNATSMARASPVLPDCELAREPVLDEPGATPWSVAEALPVLPVPAMAMAIADPLPPALAQLSDWPGTRLRLGMRPCLPEPALAAALASPLPETATATADPAPPCPGDAAAATGWGAPFGAARCVVTLGACCGGAAAPLEGCDEGSDLRFAAREPPELRLSRALGRGCGAQPIAPEVGEHASNRLGVMRVTEDAADLAIVVVWPGAGALGSAGPVGAGVPPARSPTNSAPTTTRAPASCMSTGHAGEVRASRCPAGLDATAAKSCAAVDDDGA